jgi:single stranded DNA-binding protein
MSTKFKTSFIGILGKDAELKQIGNYNYITMNVAKSEKQGQETLTDWVQCNKFAGNSPANLMQYLKKGTKVLFYGKLDVREWTNQQGETKVQFTLWVDEMELISQPKQAGQQQPTTNNAQYQQPNKFTPPTSQPMEFTAPQEDDDLPF